MTTCSSQLQESLYHDLGTSMFFQQRRWFMGHGAWPSPVDLESEGASRMGRYVPAWIWDKRRSSTYSCEGFRLRETVVRRKSGEPNLGQQRKQHFFHETTREQRSRRDNWTTRVQIALRVFFIHMKFRICLPPGGAPKGAGDIEIKQVRNHFKPNNLKSKTPNMNPIDYISPPLSVDRPTF